MWRRKPGHHSYRRKTFDNAATPGRVVIWISAIQGAPGLLREVFPAGYKTFFEQLIDQSGYKMGDVAVAHWVSFGQEWNRASVILSLVSSKNADSDSRILLLPEELV
jgi:hypothetical protein